MVFWAWNPGLYEFLAEEFPSVLAEVETFPWREIHADITTAPPREKGNGVPYLSVALVAASLSHLVDRTPEPTPGMERLRRGRQFVTQKAWDRLGRHLGKVPGPNRRFPPRLPVLQATPYCLSRFPHP